MKDDNLDWKKNSTYKISLPILGLALTFITLAFISGYTLFAYPAIMIVLCLISFDLGMQFMLFTLGINFAIFADSISLGPIHPNSLITVSQIIFMLIGIARLKQISIEKRTAFFAMFAVTYLVTIAYTPDVINGVKVFANIVLYALTLWLFSNLEDTQAEPIFKYSLVSGAVALYVYAVQFATSREALWLADPDRGLRFAGGGVHPVPLGFFMVFLIYCSVYMMEKKRSPAFLLPAFIAAIFCILTLTRMALIGLLITLVLYIYNKKLLKFAIPIMIIAVIFAAPAAMNLFLKNDAKNHQDDLNFVSSGRLTLWDLAFQQFKQHPFLGVGIGGSAVTFSIYGLITPHSDYMRVILEAGILGGVLFIIYLISQSIQVFKKMKIEPVAACMFAFLIVSMLTDSLLDYNLYFTLPVFMLAGIMNNKRHGKAFQSAEDAPPQAQNQHIHSEEKHEKNYHANDNNRKPGGFYARSKKIDGAAK